MGNTLGVYFYAISPIRHTIFKDRIDSHSATCTTTDGSNSHLCKVVIEADSATAVVWLSWIFFICHTSVTVEFHQCLSICSLAILTHPHIAILVVLHLCAHVVDYITTEDLTTRNSSPLFSFAQIILATIVVCRSIVHYSLFTTR